VLINERNQELNLQEALASLIDVTIVQDALASAEGYLCNPNHGPGRCSGTKHNAAMKDTKLVRTSVKIQSKGATCLLEQVHNSLTFHREQWRREYNGMERTCDETNRPMPKQSITKKVSVRGKAITNNGISSTTQRLEATGPAALA
jgi:hypothetical protein